MQFSSKPPPLYSAELKQNCDIIVANIFGMRQSDISLSNASDVYHHLVNLWLTHYSSFYHCCQFIHFISIELRNDIILYWMQSEPLDNKVYKMRENSCLYWSIGGEGITSKCFECLPTYKQPENWCINIIWISMTMHL